MPILAINRPIPFAVGQVLSGRYLSQPFSGDEIIAMQVLADGECFRLTLRFHEAVDVIPFESMSNFRKQVYVRVGRDGRTFEKTSDGVPHMVLAI